MNWRIGHSFLSSGLREAQYENLFAAANMGHLSSEFLAGMRKKYKTVVEELCTKSKTDALRQEIASTEDLMQGIEIMTDARHGTRKNAKDTDVICLGGLSHKCLWNGHITRAVDPVTQRHEMIGVKQMYQYFDETDTPIYLHVHDDNRSVSKYVENERPETQNAIDIWHETSKIPSKFRKISSGPNYAKGKTWHEELHDKGAPVKKHINYSLRNCNGDETKLCQMIDTVVYHYQDIHTDCPAESRCRADQHYELSKQHIKDEKAAELLTKFLHSLNLYKRPDRYKHCKDTSYVESFNRAIKIFHSKDVHFSNEECEMRNQLAILSWNENVDREYTSLSQATEVTSSRKVLKPKTHNFRSELWHKFISCL